MDVRRWLGLAWALAAPVLASAWTPDRWFEKPLTPRNANYRIEAALDFEHKVLDGRETITWRNLGTAPTAEFPVHLYLNAFKGPQSLYMKESGGHLRGDGMGAPWEPGSWGYCRLLNVAMGGQELQGHYGEDETVYWVKLPKPVQPGETIQVDLSWQSRYPRVFARSGWAGDFLRSGQWFPKVGVYRGRDWTCAAYHANTEFFSDFGVYDVSLSLPNALGLAHTGTQVNFKDENDIPKDPQHPLNVIWKLHAEDVHDFAWAVAPRAAWRKPKAVTYHDVQVFYFTADENRAAFARQRRAVENALRWSEEWYFKYPYPVLTVIDTPQDAPGADGMEYPTLITAASTDFDPFELRDDRITLPFLDVRGGPEVTTLHEFGHQYFYGMLASNEVEEPWMDEGFNSWFTHKAMERTYHAVFNSRRFFIPTDFGDWWGYWSAPVSDPLTRAGFRTLDEQSYYVTAYSKPLMVLNQLEAMLGRPLMEEVMRAYAQEMRFKHPTAQDFRRVAERVSGRDLSAFWRDFVEGTEVLDYAIRDVRAAEVTQGGWMDAPTGPVFAAPQPVAPGRRGSITLERRGGIQRPITLWVRLENTKELRLVWDGQDRWRTFDEADGVDAPVVAAVLDPDGNYPMLRDRLHASWTRKPARRGLHYWSQMAWGGLTGFLQACGIG